VTRPAHSPWCLDEEGVLDHCVCGLDMHADMFDPDAYNPDDREPMGGDPWWREDQE